MVWPPCREISGGSACGIRLLMKPLGVCLISSQKLRLFLRKVTWCFRPSNNKIIKGRGHGPFGLAPLLGNFQRQRLRDPASNETLGSLSHYFSGWATAVLWLIWISVAKKKKKPNCLTSLHYVISSKICLAVSHTNLNFCKGWRALQSCEQLSTQNHF